MSRSKFFESKRWILELAWELMPKLKASRLFNWLSPWNK